MASTGKAANDERVVLRTWLLVIGFVVVGIVLLYLSGLEYIRTEVRWLAVLFEKVGGLSLVSAATSVACNLVIKRRFLDEILAKTRLSHDVVAAGLAQVTDTFHDGDIDWRGLMITAKKIDMFFAYASTWRNAHLQTFRTICQDKDVRIRVVLPDLDNAVVRQDLALRFGYAEDLLKTKVDEAISYFVDLRDTGSATVEIWLLPFSPTLTYYRFDNKVVLATYSQQRKRTAIPTLVCEGNGSLYAFVREEFLAMIEGEKPLARKLT